MEHDDATQSYVVIAGAKILIEIGISPIQLLAEGFKNLVLRHGLLNIVLNFDRS